MKKVLSSLDFIGMSASMICALHCSAVPILLSLGFMNGTHMSHNHMFDITMLGIGLVIAIWSLWKDVTVHKSIAPIAIAVLGFTALSIGIGMHLHNPIYNILGGLSVCLAHIVNYRLAKTAKA